MIFKVLAATVALALLVIRVGGARADDPKQMILVGVDGLQFARYSALLEEQKLRHFSRLISPDGRSASAIISGHGKPITAPGNAELHSGLGAALNGIEDNTCGVSMRSGISTFERLRAFNPAIRLGSIYGKGSCYIPLPLLASARPKIDWWQDLSTYPQSEYASKACSDSRQVAAKALEFLSSYAGEPFYLVVYFGVPDCAGHAYGLPSKEYDDAVLNVDAAIGILLDGMKSKNLSSAVILSADHGWNQNSKGHSSADEHTLTIPLLTNRARLVSRAADRGRRKQCDIAPTILDYFGVKEEAFADIIDNGCASMAGSD